MSKRIVLNLADKKMVFVPSVDGGEDIIDNIVERHSSDTKDLHSRLDEYQMKASKVFKSNLFPDILSKVAKPVPGEGEEESVGTTAWERGLTKELLVWYPRQSPGNGYSERSQNVGWIPYHNIQDLLARFFLSAHETQGRIPNWREFCIGITSRVNKGQNPHGEADWHLPMFDYDGKNIKTKVKKDVKKLQKEFGLGDATVYSTRNGLHVYFFSDVVPRSTFFEMLEMTDCCRGFAKVTTDNGYAVLRLSAKYTDFDIERYKVIISPNRTAGRPGRKAAIIRALIQLGQDCGTHFAGQYPQWASYKEDPSPWKPVKRYKGKRVRKISKEEYENKAALMKNKVEAKKKNPINRDSFGASWKNLYANSNDATTTSSMYFTFKKTYFK